MEKIQAQLEQLENEKRDLIDALEQSENNNFHKSSEIRRKISEITSQIDTLKRLLSL